MTSSPEVFKDTLTPLINQLVGGELTTDQFMSQLDVLIAKPLLDRTVTVEEIPKPASIIRAEAGRRKIDRLFEPVRLSDLL